MWNSQLAAQIPSAARNCHDGELDKDLITDHETDEGLVVEDEFSCLVGSNN